MKPLTFIRRAILTAFAVFLTFTTFAQLKTTTMERAYWNGFVRYVESQGLKGSKLLNRRDLNMAQKLFEQYNRQSGKTVDYTAFVTLVQHDILEYRKQALAEIKASRLRHQQDPKFPIMFTGTDDEFMPNLSPIDGFAGALTCSWKFPSELVVGVDKARFNDIYVTNR